MSTSKVKKVESKNKRRTVPGARQPGRSSESVLEALRGIMGPREMSVEEIHARLRWNVTRKYVTQWLTRLEFAFERVGHGVYRARNDEELADSPQEAAPVPGRTEPSSTLFVEPETAPIPSAATDSAATSLDPPAGAEPIPDRLAEPAPESSEGGPPIPKQDAPATPRTEGPPQIDELDGWPNPLHLTEAFGPPFPFHTLEDWHPRLVEEPARQVQAPVDVPAVASLAALGGAAANSTTLLAQHGDEHRTNISTITVSPVGDEKTPIVGADKPSNDTAKGAEAHQEGGNPVDSPARTGTTATARSLAQGAWSKPVELAEVFGPPFPLDALFGWQRQYVTQVAEQVQIAPDAAAVALLTALAGAAAKTAFVRVQRGDYQPLNLWSQVVCQPSDGKSPLLEEIRKPFDAAQDELRDGARQKLAERTSERNVLRIELRRLEGDAAAATEADERHELIEQAGSIRRQLEALTTTLPTLTTGDCTQAGARALMAENLGRIMLLSDEGEQLFSRLGQGSAPTEIEFMLQAYSGVRIDRRVHQAESRVNSAALTLLLLIQPGPFGRVMTVPHYHDKGLMGRFLFALPRSLQGARKQRRLGLSEEAAEDYAATVRALLTRSLDQPTVLALSPDGFDTFAAWASSIDQELVTVAPSPFVTWLGKLRGHTLRLAGILHLTETARLVATDALMPKATVERAIDIAQYFREHARLACERSSTASMDEDPRRVLRWIVDGQRRSFSVAEAVSSFSNRLPSRDVARCLERLVDTGYLRERPGGRGARGRPRKPTYDVNPLLFGDDRGN